MTKVVNLNRLRSELKFNPKLILINLMKVLDADLMVKCVKSELHSSKTETFFIISNVFHLFI
jgi:hypothetical protein